MISDFTRRSLRRGVPDPAAQAGTAASGPLWPRVRQSEGRSPTALVAPHPGSLAGWGVAALMVGCLATAEASPAMAQANSEPHLGMPGFAKGFEGFFNDDGRRTEDDDLAQPTQLRSSRLSWTCVFPIEELATLSVTIDGLTLNNFNLREDTGTLSRRPFAELSFSLVNRSSKPRLPTVQFLAYDTTSPLPALAFSAGPVLDIIDARTTEQVTSSVNIRAGEFQTLRRFCVRVDG